MKKDIRAELKKLYVSAPAAPDSEGMNNVIKSIHQSNLSLAKETSLIWFILSQLRFIDVKVFLFQFALICLYGIFVNLVLQNTEGLLWLVPLSPIVVLIGTGEMSRSFRYNMIEMELSTHFSLQRILLARLIIIAAVDIASMSCLLALTLANTAIPFGALILYGVVPCFLASFGSLFIINRCPSAHIQYYTAAYCMALSLMGGLSVSLWRTWYDASAYYVWALVLLLSIAGLSMEVCTMMRNCAKLKTGEFNFGTYI